MARFPKPKQFIPKNPSKYLGDYKNIIARSSWETRVFNWCDTNKNILSWSSEEIIIPYISPLDGQMHRYFPDVMIKVNSNKGIQTFLLEIKPHAQTIVPTRGNKRKATVLNEAATYAVNQAKWKAAKIFCDDRKWVFKTITEKDLGI